MSYSETCKIHKYMADSKPKDQCNLDDIYERLEAIEKKIEPIEKTIEEIKNVFNTKVPRIYLT